MARSDIAVLKRSNHFAEVYCVTSRQKVIECEVEDNNPRGGYGACYACKKEGKVCGGFINDGKGYGNCKTCGHNFNQHA